MIQILGERRSGKTTKLLEKAGICPENYVVVVPNHRMAVFTKEMAKQMKIDVEVITFLEFMNYRYGRKDKKYLIDELDVCLETVGVIAYTNGNY